MSRCLHCTLMSLQAKPALARMGLGSCPFDPPSTTKSLKFDRECKSFKPAPPETVAKREKWAENL